MDRRTTVSRVLLSSEKKTIPRSPREGQKELTRGKVGGNQDSPSLEKKWAAPVLAIRKTEVISSSPRAVAYTSFSSLTFALVFSEH